jgi:hypothetical protein
MVIRRKMRRADSHLGNAGVCRVVGSETGVTSVASAPAPSVPTSSSHRKGWVGTSPKSDGVGAVLVSGGGGSTFYAVKDRVPSRNPRCCVRPLKFFATPLTHHSQFTLASASEIATGSMPLSFAMASAFTTVANARGSTQDWERPISRSFFPCGRAETRAPRAE